MRLLFVGPGFPGVSGAAGGSGIGTYMREIVLGLTARGHECDVLVWSCADRPGGRRDLAPLFPRPRPASPPAVDGATVWLLDRSYWPLVERIAPDSRDIASLRRAVAALDVSRGYDWIELQSEEGTEIGVLKTMPDKAILRIHTTLEQMVQFKETALTRIARRRLARERLSFQLARRILVHSQFHRDTLARLHGIGGKTCLVSHGIGLATDPPAALEELGGGPGGKPRVLVVGTADRRKGLDRIPAAVSAFAAVRGPCELAVVSEAPSGARQALGFTDLEQRGIGLTWKSGLTRKQLCTEYARASLLLHLPRYESFGIPLIEAAAAGTPVVATPVGIAPDLLHGDLSVLLVDAANPAACAAAMMKAVDGRETIGREMRRRYESGYTRDHMAERFLRVVGEWSGRSAAGRMPQIEPRQRTGRPRRRLTPGLVTRCQRSVSRVVRQLRRRIRRSEKVFTEIYEKQKWGGGRGEFYSGDGSADERIVSAYVSAIAAKASSEGFLGLVFVDLGCGDFRVGRRLLPLCSRYVGVDIVKPLIEANQRQYGNATTCFMHLDIVKRKLPKGDVCLVRQVFQHMSNRQIAAVLEKLKSYHWVFITEHYPSDNAAIVPNLDKIHGADTRVSDNSGVYLDKRPFGLPAQALEKVLEVPGVGLERGEDQGVIRTFLYRPQRRSDVRDSRNGTSTVT